MRLTYSIETDGLTYRVRWREDMPWFLCWLAARGWLRATPTYSCIVWGVEPPVSRFATLDDARRAIELHNAAMSYKAWREVDGA